MDRARRSDKALEQIASAINGALRLRYGKRSHNPDLYDKIITPPEEDKLLPLADRIVASLNRAERLRRDLMRQT
uniref:HEPN domain-containing protein n=1 Tax=Loa loa TaxID=7209 RepID=A0A1I7VUM1_LOALO